MTRRRDARFPHVRIFVALHPYGRSCSGSRVIFGVCFLFFFLFFSSLGRGSSRKPQRQSVTALHQKQASTHSTDTVDLVWGGLSFTDGQKENSAWVKAPDDLLLQVVSLVFTTAPQSQVH